MNGLFGMSVDPTLYKYCFQDDMLMGTFYLQHNGEEWCGFSIYKEEMDACHVHKGPVRKNFDFSDRYPQFSNGRMGIAFCGSKPEMFQGISRFGKTSIVFAGNITNRSEIVQNLTENQGFFFQSESNAELIISLISCYGSDGVEYGIGRAQEDIQGAYSFLMMTSDGIHAVCGPDGRWPLTIGRKKGAIAVSSETSGFSNLGFTAGEILEPGEILFLKDDFDVNAGEEFEPGKICSFLWIYIAFPAAVINGIPVSAVRKRSGACLAKKDIAAGFFPDIVAGVPYSGQLCAVGYHQEFVRWANRINWRGTIPLYDEVLFKYNYAGRRPSNHDDRERETSLKILASSENYRGKTVVICDDSIIRGRQIQSSLVPKLVKLGFQGIHFRISSPEQLSHCPWGKSTQKGQLLADRMPSIEEKERFLGVRSLRYNTIDDLVEAIGLPKEKLCLDCNMK